MTLADQWRGICPPLTEQSIDVIALLQGLDPDCSLTIIPDDRSNFQIKFSDGSTWTSREMNQ